LCGPDVRENVLRKWLREVLEDPQAAFIGRGRMKPEPVKLERLRCENAKLCMERDRLNKAAAFFMEEST
jgi:transposase